MKYLCPLCNKNSAYLSPGLDDSIICRCQGLKEVGRLVNDLYVPNIQGQQTIGLFSTGNYIFNRVETTNDFLLASRQYGIDLSFFKEGSIWTAQNVSNSVGNIIIFVSDEKILQNMYLKNKMMPSNDERNFIIDMLKKSNIIIGYKLGV